MDNLNNITKLVKHFLETDPATRNNDGLLYLKVCQLYNPDIAEKNFGEVMINARFYNLPNIKSVERTRRKMQEKYEHLCASEQVKEYRAEMEMQHKAYALDLQYE